MASNVGTHASASVAEAKKVRSAPQATFPFESVTAEASKTFTLEYTQNPVGNALHNVSSYATIKVPDTYTVVPPVTVGEVLLMISIFCGTEYAGFVYNETGFSVTSELRVIILLVGEMLVT